MHFHVERKRCNAHQSVAICKQASIELDTDLAGHPGAFNPAELLLATLSACMVKKYGTVFNTVAPGTDLEGILRRREADESAFRSGSQPACGLRP